MKILGPRVDDHVFGGAPSGTTTEVDTILLHYLQPPKEVRGLKHQDLHKAVASKITGYGQSKLTR